VTSAFAPSVPTTSSALATVVVVNWNGAHLLPACLDALAAQRTQAPFATWVIDNASTDESAQVLARYPDVRVLTAPRNLGFAGGNNFALRQVSTPYAVLLNNDAAPEPEWLERLLAPFLSSDAESDRLGAVTGKVVFLPSFLRLELSTPGFVPGPHDSRELGVRISSLCVDGAQTLPAVLWERLTYGSEGPPEAPFLWTRPAGELLIPVPRERPEAPIELSFTWAAERSKLVELRWESGAETLTVDAAASTVKAVLPAELPRIDVINNAGGMLLEGGYGADRGYQRIDDGRFDQPVEVFAACGNGMAVRTSLGHELGWFDDDFFLYYEDTDLSWRIRSRGYAIRYEPTAVVRHVHAASSKEWSPLFVFHVDRNRLLMLTKNASLTLALMAVLRYPLTTASMAVRAIRQGIADGHRPAVRQTLLRLRVMGSYLRLLPRMLTRRGNIGRQAAVRRRSLERQWLTPHAEHVGDGS
jgi:hypothetical protein